MARKYQEKLNASYSQYLANIESYVWETLAQEKIEDTDYIPGSQRIEYYAEHLRGLRNFSLDDLVQEDDLKTQPGLFENALLQRLLQARDFNLILLIGGLGAGKTTTIDHILRRFTTQSEEIRKSCPCKCAVCFREPLYLDFKYLGQAPLPSIEKASSLIFRDIRIEVYRRIIEEWLTLNDISSSEIRELDNEYLVLRRLLISNDLLLWQGDHPDLASLDYTPLRLKRPLLSTPPVTHELRKLITNYRNPARDFEPILSTTLADARVGQLFMSILLQFYIYRCHPANPKSLLVIDNLDQLPTDYIEHFARQLHDVATRTSGLPILLPLRPSSLNPVGFPRDLRYTYHYGPNNFEMILSRLENYVLLRSRTAQIKGNEDSLPAAFAKPPADREYRSFIVACYFYAKILETAIDDRIVQVHPDNRFVERLEFSPESLADIAQTLDAVVGTCCRYAFAAFLRYMRNIYSYPTVLARAEKQLSTEARRVSLLIDFPRIVNALLREPREGKKEAGRVANLFQPPVPSTKTAWPSLAKLRVLALLTKEKRVKVRQILTGLSKNGVPVDVGVEALNTLQNKFRLLLWFSTNRSLTVNPKSFDEDVVISEHGLGYFRRVIGDFEYLWHCAAEISRIETEEAAPRFASKLQAYHGLVRKVGIAEWMQHSFRRLECMEPGDIGRTGEKGRMIALTLLYSSLVRAVSSASIFLRDASRSRAATKDVQVQIGRLLEEILFWQEKYHKVYLTNGYIERYESEIARLSEALMDFRRHGSLLRELESSIEKLHDSWYPGAEILFGSSDDLNLSGRPREDVITLAARYGRGLIPEIEKTVQSLDKQERVRSFVGVFLETREKLKHLLASRVPTFEDLHRSLTFLQGDAEAVALSASEVAATGGKTLEWFLKEKKELLGMLEVLRNSRYETSTPLDRDAMSRAKVKCNRCLNVSSKLAKSLQISDLWHLAQTWQTGEEHE